MNEQLLAVAQAEIAQCRDEGLDESDTIKMAIGACVQYGRELGVIGDELSAEMRAALDLVVKHAL